MKIKPCRPYHGILSSSKLLEMPDGKSKFKVYYISIIERDKPELYEWEKCAMQKEDYEQSFTAKGFEGLGFVTALYLFLPIIFAAILENESLSYYSPFGYFGYIITKQHRILSQDAIIGLINILLCIVPAVLIVKRYNLVLSARKKM